MQTNPRHPSVEQVLEIEEFFLKVITSFNYHQQKHHHHHHNSDHQFQDPQYGEEEGDWLKTWSEEQTRRRERIEKVAIYNYGSPHVKKRGDKVTLGGEGVTPSTLFSPDLPGPQMPWKWTMHTDKFNTKWHIRLNTCK